ncbi:hypothetical protein ACO0KY_15060 [Undibacterium sp. Dicai25W]|uniref:hypothetical protein n=1 Tax=Undibacterium sp. Dicai25W TaxID=3413034 RepID=UPI003BF00DBD
MVTRPIHELKSDDGQVTYTPPDHCSTPAYSINYRPGNGVSMRLLNDQGGDFYATIYLDLKVNTHFAFTSSTVKVRTVNGTQSMDTVLTNFSYTERPSGKNLQVLPTNGISGPAPNTPFTYPSPYYATSYATEYSFITSFIAQTHGVNRFTIQLPDAVVNGQAVTFAPIIVARKELSYYHSACLR